jgi:hypothetical protein
MKCDHVWVAGMMYVHVEDVEAIAKIRKVTCEKCDVRYNHNKHKQDWQ